MKLRLACFLIGLGVAVPLFGQAGFVVYRLTDAYRWDIWQTQRSGSITVSNASVDVGHFVMAAGPVLGAIAGVIIGSALSDLVRRWVLESDRRRTDHKA
jgi:hypothetical protein